MPRYDDDDRDDFDDRPRRRRPSKSGGNATWIILGVVGGVVLLVVAMCAGGIYLVVDRTSKTFSQITSQVAGSMAAEQFCEDLKSNRATNAYNSTSKNYQAGKSRAQFDQFLAQHPELTQHQWRSVTSFNTVGQAPNHQVVVRIRLHAQPQFGDPNDPTQPADDFPPQGKGRKTMTPKQSVPTNKGGKAAKPLEDVDITLTLVDEGGVWKVDQITIP
jgi:hypothetical protein